MEPASAELPAEAASPPLHIEALYEQKKKKKKKKKKKEKGDAASGDTASGDAASGDTASGDAGRETSKGSRAQLLGRLHTLLDEISEANPNDNDVEQLCSRVKAHMDEDCHVNLDSRTSSLMSTLQSLSRGS